MSLNLFRTHIMSNKTVQERTVDGLLQLIENERWELYKQHDCMILSIYHALKWTMVFMHFSKTARQDFYQFDLSYVFAYCQK